MMRAQSKAMKKDPKSHKKTLVLITGPTAVGKTDVSIRIASHLNTHILSADARQFYRELNIGTASPSPAELSQVPHHFIGHLSLHDYYNVSRFEQDALKKLGDLFQKQNDVVLTGGSGLYIDTLLHGIDDLPDADDNVRKEVKRFYDREGLQGLRRWLKQSDPEYYDVVDQANPKRMMRALEIYLATGKKYSSLRKNQPRERPFKTIKILLNRPREELFDRINRRTETMIEDGLVEEAWQLFGYRKYNALNTVGYKEIYSWLSNKWNLSKAVEKIKTNTRRYAKRQLTWFKRYDDARWFHPDETDQMLSWIEDKTGS